MRVGIDARVLADPLTGIGRYTTELTNELVKKTGEFLIYSGGLFPTKRWQKGNVSFRSANLQNRAARMFWSQTQLPYWVARDYVDVFWGTSHRLPRYLPAGTARVVTIHDLVWKYQADTMRPLSQWLESVLMPQAIRMADIIIVDSISTAIAVKSQFPKAVSRVRVVYPGKTDLPAPCNLQSASILKIKNPYVLFVGTLEPRKNLQRLLRAYAMLDADVRSSVQLVIAGGEGWGNINLHQLIDELGLHDQVNLAGYVTDQQLSDLYAGCLFLAMPSLYEGFGLPIVEAMSYGKAVLTSNVSSMPEVAGKAAVLVNPIDVHSISSGLKVLLKKEERIKLEAESKKSSERFNWENSAEKLWEIFQEAIHIRKAMIKKKRL